MIALIDDPYVVRRILEHLGRWEPLPTERGPPGPDWPPGAVIPSTYGLVPDIAEQAARAKPFPSPTIRGRPTLRGRKVVAETSVNGLREPEKRRHYLSRLTESARASLRPAR